MESESPLYVNREFIEDNKKIIFKNSKKGGPYSKAEKEKRQNEVHRLHFDYGYSARKIADMIKISRNTVNDDLSYWYARIYQSTNTFDPQMAIVVNMHRLDVQRSRLREQLDKTKAFQERMTIERMMYEIDYKLLQTYHRLSESMIRLHDFHINKLNQDMAKKNEKQRYTSFYNSLRVSSNARKKIVKIMWHDILGTHRV